nr:uncharacterized protein LOC109167964 isoform X2 [Ipomoea batatas]GMD72396.1 uncharacterized protein LOC109167964 isoform X2 [Ipomoea batatas]GME18594.1 uncharacterized protein LOC109167964 isoform X2 [Ipomoea batatas]
MLGAGLQFNRSRNGDDRFYCAAKARRSQSQSLSSRQNHQNQDHTRGAKSDFAVSRSAKSDVRASADEPLKENSVIVAEPVREVSSVSNIQRFLHSITPSVTAQHHPKVH